jgi:hypothetical protein
MGCLQPVMRAHGSRMHNWVWSYGKQAEPILAKHRKLRYQLLPDTYSLPYESDICRSFRICLCSERRWPTHDQCDRITDEDSNRT